MSFTRALVVGDAYALDTNLSISALLRGIGPQPYGIHLDFLDTLTLQGVVLTEGLGSLQLIGDSGRDYLTAVPDPASGWLLATAIGAIAAWRRRSAPAGASGAR
jgi:hypothetical protein